jgi:hypothetical protein
VAETGSRATRGGRQPAGAGGGRAAPVRVGVVCRVRRARSRGPAGGGAQPAAGGPRSCGLRGPGVRRTGRGARRCAERDRGSGSLGSVALEAEQPWCVGLGHSPGVVQALAAQRARQVAAEAALMRPPGSPVSDRLFMPLSSSKLRSPRAAGVQDLDRRLLRALLEPRRPRARRAARAQERAPALPARRFGALLSGARLAGHRAARSADRRGAAGAPAADPVVVLAGARRPAPTGQGGDPPDDGLRAARARLTALARRSGRKLTAALECGSHSWRARAAVQPELRRRDLAGISREVQMWLLLMPCARARSRTGRPVSSTLTR